MPPPCCKSVKLSSSGLEIGVVFEVLQTGETGTFCTNPMKRVRLCLLMIAAVSRTRNGCLADPHGTFPGSLQPLIAHH